VSTTATSRLFLLGVGARDGALTLKTLAALESCAAAVAAPSAAARLPFLRKLAPKVRFAAGGAPEWKALLRSPAARKGAAFLTADFPLWDPEGAAALALCGRRRPAVVAGPGSLGAALSAARSPEQLPQGWFGGFRVTPFGLERP
jgi:hypothetical protein